MEVPLFFNSHTCVVQGCMDLKRITLVYIHVYITYTTWNHLGVGSAVECMYFKWKSVLTWTCLGACMFLQSWLLRKQYTWHRDTDNVHLVKNCSYIGSIPDPIFLMLFHNTVQQTKLISEFIFCDFCTIYCTLLLHLICFVLFWMLASTSYKFSSYFAQQLKVHGPIS